MEIDNLIAKSQSGDERAFETIVYMFEKYIYTIAYHYVQNQEDAKDVTQDTFVKLWKTLGTYRRECSFKTWLSKICVSCAIDSLRKRKNDVSLTLSEDGEETDIADESDDTDPVCSYEKQEEKEKLQKALLQLDNEKRQIITMRYIAGLSYKEIGEILKLEQGTVKSRLNRGVLMLKKLMKQGTFL